VCRHVVQCVAMPCSLSQCDVLCCSVLQSASHCVAEYAAECFEVSFGVCCVLQCELQYVAVCCSVLQCVAAYFSVLQMQCVAA